MSTLIQKVFLSRPALLSWLLIPWIWQLTASLRWTPLPEFLPYQPEVFGDLLRALGDRVIAIPHSLSGAFLVFIVFLPSLLALAGTSLVARMTADLESISRKLLVGGVLIGLLYLGPTGGRLQPILSVFFFLCFCFPFTARVNALSVWVLATFGGLVALQNHSLAVFVIWAFFSYLTPTALHFLIVDRGQLARPLRMTPLRTISFMLGVIALSLWFFSILSQFEFSTYLFVSSEFWYGSFLLSGLLVVLAFLFPWESLKWLRLGFLSQGLLFSPIFELPSLILGLYLLSQILKPIAARLAAVREKAVFLVIPVLFILSFLTAFRVDRTRHLPWDSRAALRQVLETQPTGLYVFGPSRPFFSLLAGVPVFGPDDFALEESEPRFVALLDERKISDLLIEREELEAFWRSRLQSGQSVNITNSSIISRLTTRRLEALKTATLDLPAITQIQVVDLKGAPHFVWGKRHDAKL